jgi:N-acetylglutamate synthase-like GNAT family acetyltransferase
VQDVLVHPKLQRLGIGSQLLKKLTAQLAAQDVWEVGALTTTSLTPFLAHNGFEPDKEASLPMVLPLEAARRLGGASAQLRTNFELQQLMLDKM